MINFEIGIIGGTGGIGRWFADFFRTNGYTVHVTGRNKGMSPSELARSCRVVFVSVPIGSTIEVIGQIGPLMDKGALLADFTSLKAGPVRAMLESSACEVAGTHPLFGPDIASLAGQNIILCRARGERWIGWLRDVFEKGGAAVTEADPEEHDRKMAAVQVLPHLGTIAMGAVLRGLGETPAGLEKFATPVFRERLRMIGKVFGHPGLYAGIIRENPGSRQVISLCRETLARIEELLNADGTDDFLKELNELGDALGSEGQKKDLTGAQRS